MGRALRLRETGGCRRRASELALRDPIDQAALHAGSVTKATATLDHRKVE